MYDIGDAVLLTVKWTDATGALVDPASLTVTLTLPDATTASPTPVKDSTGNYHISYTATQAGRHTVYWLGSGTNGAAYNDAFDVSNPDPGFIISLADVKTQLSITSNTYDEELRMWLGATTDIVEHYVGSVVARTYTEAYDGGAYTIATWHAPIISVTSITEYMGSVTYTLTNQPVGSAVDAYGYSIDNPVGGVIARRSSASWPIPFMRGEGNVIVTYIAGRKVIPWAIQAAARLIVQTLWKNRRGPSGNPALGPATNDVAVPGMGYAVPGDAIELLERFERLPGIG